MQSDIVQRLQPILRRNGWGNVKEYSRHIPFMLEREGLCIVETTEITRLTEALRAAEEREKALLSALEEWMFRYFWRVDGMPVEAARIHAQSRMKIAALAGAKP